MKAAFHRGCLQTFSLCFHSIVPPAGTLFLPSDSAVINCRRQTRCWHSFTHTRVPPLLLVDWMNRRRIPVPTDWRPSAQPTQEINQEIKCLFGIYSKTHKPKQGFCTICMHNRLDNGSKVCTNCTNVIARIDSVHTKYPKEIKNEMIHRLLEKRNEWHWNWLVEDFGKTSNA